MYDRNMRIHKRPEGTGITVENVEGNMEGMKLDCVREFLCFQHNIRHRRRN
jgi:hypothetical protein